MAFAQWGIDLIGSLLMAEGQARYAVDYITKWAEVEPLAKITEGKLKHFVWKLIICKFGIPHTIVSNNGRQFDNSRFKEFCSNLGITNALLSPTHPQANG